MADINNIDRGIIERNIKTEEGFRQFVATRLWSMDEKIDSISRLCPVHSNRISAVENDQKRIRTGWNTLKWVCGILWGMVVFIAGLLYREMK